jgi:hypothetical protein
MKVYKILIKAYQHVLVEADTDDEAFEAAHDCVSLGDLEHDESSIDEIITDEKELEHSKRHYEYFPKED